ncbi:Protein kinase, membrane associated tyrosine threonine 1 [Coelomomyces lativittatus]|nr:Protein kinase, membrane associated tyrosine threonine 1 [Coelomomyces lativittatus]
MIQYPHPHYEASQAHLMKKKRLSSQSLLPPTTPPPPTTSPTLLTPSHLPLPSSTSSLSSPSLLLLQHPPPFTHPRSPSNDMTQSLSRLPSPRSDPGLLPLTSWSPPSMLCLEDEDKDGEGEEEEEEEEEEEDEEDGDQGNGSEILFTPLHSACHPVMSKWKSRRSQKTRRKKNNGSYRLPFTFPSTNVDPPPPPPPHSHGKPTKEEQKEGLLKLKNLPLNEFPLPPTTEVQETTQKKHLLLSTPHGTKSPITISSSQVLHGNTPEPFVFHPIHLLQHHRPLSPPPPMLFLSSLHALRFTFPHFLTLDYFDTQFPALPTPPTLTSSSSSVSKPRSSKSASSIRLPSRTSVPSPFKTSSFTKKIRSTETETKTGNEEKEEKKNMPPSLLPFQQKTKNDGSLSLRHRPLSMSISKDSYYFRKNKDKEEDEDVDEAPDYFHTHFEDIEEHGTGSFSTVYHVRRIEDGRKMAVKQLKVPYVSLADRQQKLKEVHVWLQLPKHHPHLLGLELAWEQSGFVYMLMEYAPMDLNMYLHYRASSPYQEEEVWDLMHDVVHGLAKLHALGWIHLDLKPANILVRSLDPLMYQIADFSLTSSLQEVKGGGEGRGAPQVMEGDAKYLAPEALLHHQFGTFTDMYAVGLIMLETMSNAELPNKGDLYDRLRRGCIDDYMPFLLGFSNGCCGCVLHCINPTPWCRPSALHWCLECPPILQAVQRRGPRYFNVLQAIPSNEDLLGPCTSPFNPPSKPPRSPVPPHSSS